MGRLIGTDDIAVMLRRSRKRVTDVFTKADGFPEPVINESQKTRYWDSDEVMQWFVKRARKRRPRSNPAQKL
jgi:hypothetical protein